MSSVSRNGNYLMTKSNEQSNQDILFLIPFSFIEESVCYKKHGAWSYRSFFIGLFTSYIFTSRFTAGHTLRQMQDR